MTVSKDAEAMINARIAQIDHLLSIQLNEVLHHAAFQKLEGTWRGLKYLLDQSETSDKLKIKVLNVNEERAAARPAARAGVRPERHVQEGLRGGVRHLRRRSVRGPGRRLRIRPRAGGYRAAGEDLAGGGRGARAVPDGGFAPRCSTWTASPASTRRATSARSSTPPSTPSGRSFRQSEDSRYVGLCLPHVLVRLPYGKDDVNGRSLQLRRGRGRHRSQQVPVGQRRLGAGRAADAVVRALRLVRGDPRRRGRRAGGRPADPQLLHRRGRRGHEVPHAKRPSPTAARRNSPTWASSRWCTARAPTTRRSSACSRRRSRSCTTRKRPTPTPAFRRSCRTSWRSRGSPIT